MKKRIDYSKWSTEKLQKQLKALRFATGLLAGLLIVLLGTVIFISFKDKEINPLLVTPIALSAIIPLNYKRMKEMRQEIENRGQQS